MVRLQVLLMQQVMRMPSALGGTGWCLRCEGESPGDGLGSGKGQAWGLPAVL